MGEVLNRFFRIEANGSTLRRELVAGVTTFLTVAYIIIVNPAILEAAGIPRGPSMVATIISGAFGTFVMGFYANRPFAVAPYMGQNAFVAYTIVEILGFTWQTAIGAIFISGVLFVLLTVFKVRSWFVQAIPQSLKYAFAVGIGLFLTFIGLVDTGIVVLGTESAPVRIGALSAPAPLMALLGFLLISLLLTLRIRGGILLGIVTMTVAGYITGQTPLPEQFVSAPPSLAPIFMELNIAGALTWGGLSVVLMIFVMDFVDTMGTLIGLSARAGLLDEEGNLPGIEKPMMADALGTVVASLVGTTTTGTYIESASGIEAGGRTGLTAVVAGVLFFLGLFFAPFVMSIPAYAYGPALIVVGGLMIGVVREINFDDLTEQVPAFVTIILMSFTFNIGIGITAGFVIYPLMKLFTGRAGELHPGMWGLFVLSLLFYLFYPYR